MADKFTVVAASSPLRLALRRGDDFFVREFDKPDAPMPCEDPSTMQAALITKWGMLPVDGEPEIAEDEYPILDGPVKDSAGAESWKVESIEPYVVPKGKAQ